MATFVLVHGAWAGAHGFRLVRPLLRAAGHDVFTPSLTGIGERVHLSSPQVDLTTHVRDVVNASSTRTSRTSCCSASPTAASSSPARSSTSTHRVRELVYLDAFVPGDGDTVMSLAGAGVDPPRMSVGADWFVPAAPREYDDPDEAAFAEPRRVPHPIGCFTERVRLRRPLEDFPFGRTYIKATAARPDDPGERPFRAAAERARTSAAWRFHEIDTNHMVASNRPAELADILLSLA